MVGINLSTWATLSNRRHKEELCVCMCAHRYVSCAYNLRHDVRYAAPLSRARGQPGSLLEGCLDVRMTYARHMHEHSPLFIILSVRIHPAGSAHRIGTGRSGRLLSAGSASLSGGKIMCINPDSSIQIWTDLDDVVKE